MHTRTCLRMQTRAATRRCSRDPCPGGGVGMLTSNRGSSAPHIPCPAARNQARKGQQATGFRGNSLVACRYRLLCGGAWQPWHHPAAVRPLPQRGWFCGVLPPAARIEDKAYGAACYTVIKNVDSRDTLNTYSSYSSSRGLILAISLMDRWQLSEHAESTVLPTAPAWQSSGRKTRCGHSDQMQPP